MARSEIGVVRPRALRGGVIRHCAGGQQRGSCRTKSYQHGRMVSLRCVAVELDALSGKPVVTSPTV
jgi:hypothetical protein